jgi:hypothetical protein
MVKSGFLKTIQNNMSLKKIFIILGVLSVIIVILFSCVNNYSVENFKPKPNVKAEIYLWVGPHGSFENDLVRRWLDFTKEYGNTPNIKLGRGKASEFTKYLELDKYPESNLNTNKVLERLKSVDLTKDYKLVPFVTLFFVGVQDGKAYKNPIGFGTDKEVTYDNLSKTINFLTALYYDSLYENDVNVVPAAPAAPAASAARAASAASKVPWA